MSGAGQLFIIAAPSGAGKTSLVRALLESLEAVTVSVSHTTRAPRPGEREGQDYYYVNTQTFEQLIAADEFLEYARVFDHYYGTRRAEVDRKLVQGIDVILEIDWQGAQQVRAKWPGSQGIFILPPSLSALRQRLQQRGQDEPDVIERRMRDAVSEMSHYDEFDYLIINDEFEQSLAALRAIFIACRQRKEIQILRRQALIHGLLNQ
ncbi:MAG: guanylate kinase [Candidatus Competibacteraceae bacterium]|nr:guanylate kinase [Candidatus Competibacteraceae bacterium]MCB1805404.1 guanylate kinase [Candidatus Competibacteraceae bacterium]MCB1814218.1 guanylate kinase [Candidatus Competibacteraceae bacterium]